jgi:hypothetical protein
MVVLYNILIESDLPIKFLDHYTETYSQVRIVKYFLKFLRGVITLALKALLEYTSRKFPTRQEMLELKRIFCLLLYAEGIY